MSEHFYVITGSWQYKQAPGSFIFSLRNKEDLSPFKAPLKDENTPFAIYAENSYGPTFGGGYYGHYDIYIPNDALNTYSHTNFNYNYQAPSGVSDTSTILAGTYYFQPSEIEVLYCLELISIYIRALNILISQTKFKVLMQRNLLHFL